MRGARTFGKDAVADNPRADFQSASRGGYTISKVGVVAAKSQQGLVGRPSPWVFQVVTIAFDCSCKLQQAAVFAKPDNEVACLQRRHCRPVSLATSFFSVRSKSLLTMTNTKSFAHNFGHSLCQVRIQRNLHPSQHTNHSHHTTTRMLFNTGEQLSCSHSSRFPTIKEHYNFERKLRAELTISWKRDCKRITPAAVKLCGRATTSAPNSMVDVVLESPGATQKEKGGAGDVIPRCESGGVPCECHSMISSFLQNTAA